MPSLYGLLVRAQRLSGCWDSAGQLMSNKYVDRVMISDFIFFLSQKLDRQFLSSSSSTLIKSPQSLIPNQSQVLSRIYPTNIITLFLFFSYMGHQGHTFQITCLSHHATIYYYAVLPFLFYYPAIATKPQGREPIPSNTFMCACKSGLIRRQFSHPTQSQPPP